MTRTLPWPTVDGFNFAVRGLSIDGGDRTDLVETLAHRVDAHRAERWTTLHLDIECERPPGLSSSIRAAVVLLNTSGRLRLSAPLHGDNSCLTGSLAVDRESVAHRGNLSVVLTDQIDGIGSRILGESAAWTVDFDPPRPTPPGGFVPLPMAWDSFSNPEHGPAVLPALSGSPSYVHFGSEPPTLFLNKDLAQVHDLLMWDTARGWKRSLQDAVAVDIAGKAVTSMIHAAFADIIEGDDGPEGPFRDSLTTLLEQLVDYLEGVSTIDEIRTQVLEGRSDFEASATLFARVAAAVELMTGTSDTFQKLAGQAFE